MPTPEERVARTINSAWAPLENYATSAEARSLIAARDAGSVIRNAPWTEWLNKLTPLQPALNVSIGESLRNGLQARASFDVLDAISQRYAAEQAGKLVASISEVQRGVIRDVIQGAMSGNDTVDTAAAKLRRSIGLHPAWQRAVETRHERLFSNAIKAGKNVEQATVIANRMTEKYRQKLLRTRALNIARTEIATANNVGLYASWEQAVKTGDADVASRKEWAPGPRACPHCAPISGEVVQWDQPFSNGMMMPPAHPGCRCTGNLLPPEYETGWINDDLNPRPINWLTPDARGEMGGVVGDLLLPDPASIAIGAVTTSGADDLLFAYQQGFTEERELVGGFSADYVALGKLHNGERVVLKDVGSRAEADKEVVAARLYELMGGTGYRVAKTGERQVVMDYIDGETGMEWRARVQDAEFSGAMSWDDAEAAREALYNQEGSRQVALLDWMLENEDRNSGNFILKDGAVTPIDHGMSEFRDKQMGWNAQPGERWLLAGPFARRHLGLEVVDDYDLKIVGYDPSKSAWSQAELRELRSKVVGESATTFKDHENWHEFVLSRLDYLIGE